MPHGDTVFFPMTDYWMGRLVNGRRVEVRARTAHWARLIPGRRYARFQVGNFRGPQLLFMVAAVEVVSYDLIYWGVSYTHRVPIQAAPAGMRHGLKGRKHAQIYDSHVFTA